MSHNKPIENAFTKAGTLSGATGALTERIVDRAIGGLSPFNKFGRYFTGSRAIISINSKLFGFAFKVDISINTAHDEIWTIDDWTPWELAPRKVIVSGTLGMFHVPGKGPATENVMGTVLSFLQHKYITIDIRDHTTDNTIFKTNKAVITGRKQNIEAGRPSTIELTWRSVGWIDEKNPATLQEPPGGDEKDGSFFSDFIPSFKPPF